MKSLWIIGLLVLLLAGCIPLQITGVKVMHDECDCVCLSWQTNQEAICKVTYCKDGLCYTSPLEDQFITDHWIGLPTRTAESVTITAISRSGQTVSLEIK